MTQPSTLVLILEEGMAAGLPRGRLEGRCSRWSDLLLRQGIRRFGPPAEQQRLLLERLAEVVDLETLGRLADTVGDAASWNDWLAGIEPPAAPPHPDYLIGRKPSDGKRQPEAGFDIISKVPLKASGEMVVLHLRLQNWYEERLDEKMYRWNINLKRNHRLQVMSCLFLVTHHAEGPDVTGRYRERVKAKGESRRKEYKYPIARIWEKPVDELLRSETGLLVLAPLAKIQESDLSAVIGKMKTRIAATAKDEAEQAAWWSMAYVQMGKRWPGELCQRLVEEHGVMHLIRQAEEFRWALADGYFTGLEQGRAEVSDEACRELLLRQGERRWGPLDEATRAALAPPREPNAWHILAARLMEVKSWRELLEVATTP